MQEEITKKIRILEGVSEEEAKNPIKKFWEYLKKDTWDSWFVSLVLIALLIKFIFFPTLSILTGSSLPLVVVESCSLYHETSFNEWWDKNAVWYESKGIEKQNFEDYPFKDGMNKGDIIILWNHSPPEIGDIIVFNSQTKHPLIHRVISLSPLATKGDHNSDQLSIETNIDKSALIGKSIVKIPLVGWAKLIFFEPFRAQQDRGLCK